MLVSHRHEDGEVGVTPLEGSPLAGGGGPTLRGLTPMGTWDFGRMDGATITQA